MPNIEMGCEWWVQKPLTLKNEKEEFSTIQEARLEISKRNFTLAKERGLLDEVFPAFAEMKCTYRMYYMSEGYYENE